jgi:3-oxoacyl-[acyl-carrier protein] reductase
MKDDKVLLIIGASSDLGYNLLESIYDNYSIIFAHYCNNIDRLKELQNRIGDKLILIKDCFDIDPKVNNIIATIKNFNVKPNHIVHLASTKADILQFKKRSWIDYEEQIFTSIKPIVEILEEYLPNMVHQRHGRVIFMLSSLIIGIPPKFQSPYITTKYALLGLMKSLAVEYADKGITFNGISPNMIDTKFISNLPDLIVQNYSLKSPLGRNLRVEDIIPTFKYLLSESAGAVIGSNLEISGGM